MLILIALLVVTALAALTLAYVNAAGLAWVALCAIVIASAYVLGEQVVANAYLLQALPVLAIAAAVLLAVVAIPLNVVPLRRSLISGRLLGAFRKVMPPMSQTEREALEAGSVWWDGELFSGNPDWNKLLAVPAPTLTADEQRFLDDQVETLCAMVSDWETTNVYKDLPPPVWQYIKDHGFLGMIIPKEFGGLGFSAYAHSQVVTKLSTRSGTVAVTVLVPNSLGPGELLLHYGTDAQKQHYLPRLAKGLEIPCFALTNPNAGSDAAAIPDFGIVGWGEHEGKRVLGLRVTWDKRYITLGPVATLLGLAFRVYDPDHLLGQRKPRRRPRHHLRADPHVASGRAHRPAAHAAQRGVPEWTELGPRRVHPARLGDRRRADDRQGLADADGVPRRRARHLAALVEHRRIQARRAHDRRLRARADAVQDADRALRRHRGAARAHGRQPLPHGGDAHPHRARGRPGREACGAVGHREAAPDRAQPAVINDAMDIVGGKGICMGPSNFLGARVHADAGVDHRRGREHPHAQPDRLRAGRHPLPSLRAEGDRRHGRAGPRPRDRRVRSRRCSDTCASRCRTSRVRWSRASPARSSCVYRTSHPRRAVTTSASRASRRRWPSWPTCRWERWAARSSARRSCRRAWATSSRCCICARRPSSATNPKAVRLRMRR